MKQNSQLIYKKNILRQRPRLLYAGSNSSGEGWINQPNSLEHSLLMLLKSGSGKLKIENNTYPITAGDLIIVNKGVTHSEFLEGSADRELLFLSVGNLHIAGLEADTIIKDKPFIIIPTKTYADRLSNLFKDLITESELSQPFSDSVSEHLLKIILMMVLRIASFDYDLILKQNSAYLDAKEYFDKNFTTIANMDNVCKDLYINKFYLTHVFSEQMGVPPIKYLIQKKIELACHYLETSDMNVYDVAKACGYLDDAYFCRVFKNIMGVTPLRYRFNYKEKQKNKFN